MAGQDTAADPAKALECKEKGNKCFQAGDYHGAEELYSKAHVPLFHPPVFCPSTPFKLAEFLRSTQRILLTIPLPQHLLRPNKPPPLHQPHPRPAKTPPLPARHNPLPTMHFSLPSPFHIPKSALPARTSANRTPPPLRSSRVSENRAFSLRRRGDCRWEGRE
jgi:hypothetical protein